MRKKVELTAREMPTWNATKAKVERYDEGQRANIDRLETDEAKQ